MGELRGVLCQAPSWLRLVANVEEERVARRVYEQMGVAEQHAGDELPFLPFQVYKRPRVLVDEVHAGIGDHYVEGRPSSVPGWMAKRKCV